MVNGKVFWLQGGTEPRTHPVGRLLSKFPLLSLFPLLCKLLAGPTLGGCHGSKRVTAVELLLQCSCIQHELLIPYITEYLQCFFFILQVHLQLEILALCRELQQINCRGGTCQHIIPKSLQVADPEHNQLQGSNYYGAVFHP